MKKSSKVVTHQPLPFLLVEFLMFPLLGLSLGVINLCLLKRGLFPNIADSIMLGLGLTAFLFTLAGFILYLFVEYKYNRLKLKNIFLYLSIAIAVINLIAVLSLPSQMALPNDAELVITPTMRAYYIISGFFYAILPYLCFYLIPRRVMSNRYLDIFLYVVLGFALLTIVLSFATDWKHYLNIFQTFDLKNNPIGSIFFDKFSFAFVLLSGMFASIFLRIRHKNYKWALYLIPLYLFLMLTASKITMFVATVIVFVYVVIQLVFVCKKSKDNLIITLLIVFLILSISSLYIVGIARSETGILADIRKAFLDFVEHARETISSRQLIWESAFKLLSSWRVIFGYGINSFGYTFHQVYVKVAPEFDLNIYASHNFAVELLGNGGIFLLGIYLFLYGYLIYAALKLRKTQPWFTISSIVFLLMFVIINSFTPSCLCGLTIDAIPSIVIILPIMSEYYITIDEDEKAIRTDIVNNVKVIKNSNPQSKLMVWNKKRLLNEAKYIAYDLNMKIKL